VEFSPFAIGIVCLTAFLTGMAKTGIQGLGIVLVPLAAMAMPVKASTGFLLPLMVAGDFVAVIYWRRKVVWKRLLGVLPWTALGIVGGFFAMRALSEALFKPLLGGLILAFVALDFLGRRVGFELKPDHRIVVFFVGILAGAFTMMANAGGPIMTIFLLSMALPKEEYVGTTAVFFWLINLFKIPFSISLGLITWPSLRADLFLLPLVLLGCGVGFYSVKKLPQRAFNLVAQVLAALGGLKLFF
jgi:uncharacterized protein